MKHLIAVVSASLCLTSSWAEAQTPSVSPTQTSKPSVAQGALDYVNPKPMPLPQSPVQGGSLSGTAIPHPVYSGPPAVSQGAVGSGATKPVRLAPARSDASPMSGSGQTPQDFGSAGLPYDTFRVNSYGASDTYNYPYRAAGLLLFLIGNDTYQCSASLVRPGIVVTAGHCVANFGKSQFYTGWQFLPGYDDGVAPYGAWNATGATVLTSYYNGTDPCTVYGVVCQDDVAVLTLAPDGSGALPGPSTGYFAIGINGYSFAYKSQALISQLGYPVSLDYGIRMERNDAQGTVDPNQVNNTLIGSLMTGGSSGGPWVVNFGQAPVNSLRFGAAPVRNTLVGVTSWGYTAANVKEQGASGFTSANIDVLLQAACGATPGAC